MQATRTKLNVSSRVANPAGCKSCKAVAVPRYGMLMVMRMACEKKGMRQGPTHHCSVVILS